MSLISQTVIMLEEDIYKRNIWQLLEKLARGVNKVIVNINHDADHILSSEMYQKCIAITVLSQINVPV